MALEDVALPGSLLWAARQPGWQNPSSCLCSLSQAWHVFTPLARRADSPK